MSWDERWMGLARHVAGWSKDRSVGIGAVIVDDRNVLRAVGWNGFPRGVDDDVPGRHERPAKYQWTEHAERNAIFNAAAEGIVLRGCTMYGTVCPCADCARAIIQAGIVKLVISDRALPPTPDGMETPTWRDTVGMALNMLKEAGVGVWFLADEELLAAGDL